MSISNTTETAILSLIFNATTWANYAQNASSSPQTAIGNALHTADPGETGNASTSEVAYTSYARVDVTRDNSNWTVINNSVSPAANIDFPNGTGGSGTVTHWSTCKTGGGAAAILWSGTVTPSISCGNGVQPRLSVASAITLD